MDKVFAGMGLSVLLDSIWRLWPGSAAFKLAIQQNPLSFIEHHHVGLSALLLADRAKSYSQYVKGVGAGLILIEATQTNPFGIGKPTQNMSLAATTILGGLLMIKHGSK